MMVPEQKIKEWRVKSKVKEEDGYQLKISKCPLVNRKSKRKKKQKRLNNSSPLLSIHLTSFWCLMCFLTFHNFRLAGKLQHQQMWEKIVFHEHFSPFFLFSFIQFNYVSRRFHFPCLAQRASHCFVFSGLVLNLDFLLSLNNFLNR